MGGMGEMDKPAPPAGPLKITYGDKSATWTPTTLAALPHQTVTVYNEHTKANETYSGVPVMELLTPLGVPAKPHGKELRLYLWPLAPTATKWFSRLARSPPTSTMRTMIVADSEDGKAAHRRRAAEIDLPREIRCPARWVRNLVAIRVLAAE